jgi:hypothetical protein
MLPGVTASPTFRDEWVVLLPPQILQIESNQSVKLNKINYLRFGITPSTASLSLVAASRDWNSSLSAGTNTPEMAEKDVVGFCQPPRPKCSF